MITYETQLNNDLQWALHEGSMHFEGGSAVHETLRRIVERLNDLDIDYAIAGGMALFFHGYRRFTEDVDVLVTAEGLEKIHAKLDGLGYVRPFEKSKNLRDTVTGVKIDFLVTGGYPGDGKPGPIAFPVPRDVAVETEGIQIVSLKAIVELKLASGKASHRSGDLHDVQRLIRVLQLPQKFCEQLEPSVQELYLKKWHDAQKEAEEES
ncbi:MAG: nucleotidyl transferase AbiEii/AbiGii toxin family protein [Planctomycetes bacterium]|nr:nucleotidyl transferase AbiEii/AbiGii toxin family protein [Planctomycetota bacterium]